MKKIYYLFAWIAAATAFVSCKPLDKSYKALDGMGKPAQTLNYTLQAADYGLLPSTAPAKTSLSFATTADANTNIPAILNYKFFDYGDGSNANITYTVPAPSVVLADSVFKDVAYTLTNTDYTLLPGNKFTDFSASQILSWLPYKYPAPAVNQLAVLTFNYFSSPTTTVQTFSYLYLNGAWKQVYMISNAQYASVTRGSFNQFTSADDASLRSYLNAILKADVTLSATAKAGNIQYISFNYYVTATKSTYQRVIPLIFDGTNWGDVTTVNALPFAKSKGTWIADPTVYYTLTKADTQLIGDPNGTLGTTTLRGDLYKYGDFDSGWTKADIQAGIILCLAKDFPSPKVNIDYKVTYLAYNGTDVPTVLTFQFNGTTWVTKP